MKKIRFYYWLVKGFIQKHTLIIGVSVFVGALSFGLLPFLLKYAPEIKTTTYVGRVGDYTLSNLPRDIQSKISQGLTEIDDQGKAIPGLASEWQILDEGKTYVFTIGEDQYWQDGEPVTAYDVNLDINGATAEVRDDNTIVYTLEEAYTPFPTILSQPLFRRTKKNYFQIFEKISIWGTGDYQLKKLKLYSYDAIEEFTLESDTEKIVYRFYPTEQAATLAFKLAEVDVLEKITTPTELADWPKVRVEKDESYNQYVAVFLNNADANLSDKSLRQALNYLTPKIDDPEKRALNPISPTSWAYNPNVKPYEYSLETAQELVSNLNTDFELELTTTPAFTELAESIIDSWELLGMDVSLNIVNVPDTSDYQALLIGQRIPHDPDQYLLWHSTQDSTNITNYAAAKVDKLLEDARKELNEDERKAQYQDFQRFLLEDSPAIFLQFIDTYTIYRN